MQVQAARDTFVIWQHIILVYALLMGIEGPVLLLVARYRSRPWRELLLVALPAGAFAWMMAVVRHVQAAYDYWRSYMQFQAWRYPPAFAEQSAGDIVSAAAGVPLLGWIVCAVAAALVLLGWLLLVPWDPRIRPPAKPVAGEAPTGGGPVLPPSKAEAGSTGGDEFEMHVEPTGPDS